MGHDTITQAPAGLALSLLAGSVGSFDTHTVSRPMDAASVAAHDNLRAECFLRTVGNQKINGYVLMSHYSQTGSISALNRMGTIQFSLDALKAGGARQF